MSVRRGSFVLIAWVVTLVLSAGCRPVIIESPTSGSIEEGTVEALVTWDAALDPDTFRAEMNGSDVTGDFTVGATSAEADFDLVPGKKQLSASVTNTEGSEFGTDSVIFISTTILGRDDFDGGLLSFTCESSLLELEIYVPDLDPDLGLSELFCSLLPVSGIFPAGDSTFPKTPFLPFIYGVFPFTVTFDEHATIANALSMSEVRIEVEFPFDPEDEGKVCALGFDLIDFLIPANNGDRDDDIIATITQEMDDIVISVVVAEECVETFESNPGEIIFDLNMAAAVDDKGQPLMNLSSPGNGPTGASEVLVAGSVLDDSRIAPSVEINGTEVDVDPDTGAFSERFALGRAPNRIEVRAVDRVGKEVLVVRNVVFDTTPPMLTVLEPVEGSVVFEPEVLVVGEAADDLSVPVVLVNGTPVPVDGRGLFTHTVTLLPGHNVLEIAATDGVSEVTETRSLAYDPTSFVLRVLEPADGTVTNAPFVTVSGYSVDPTGDVPLVHINGQDVALVGHGFSTVVALVPGENHIVVDADAAPGFDHDERLVWLDVEPPQLDIASPPPGHVTAVQELVVTGTIFDELGPVDVSIDGEPLDVAPGRGAFSKTILLAPGANEIEIAASDAVNDIGETLSVIWDDRPPVLVLIYPQDGEVVEGGGVTVMGYVSDDRVSIDSVLVGEEAVDVAGADGSFLYRAAVETGENTVTVKATDGVNEVVIERNVHRE